MPSLNLHSLFDTRVEGRVAFLDNLTLAPDDRKLMLSARTDIRARLKARLPKRIQKKAEDAGQGHIEVPEPRFFTQGSWSYKTLNAPCRPLNRLIWMTVYTCRLAISKASRRRR